MKLEPRGKYAGVKIHLDDQECKEILPLAPEKSLSSTPTDLGVKEKWIAIKFGFKLAKAIYALMKEHPKLLEPRTEAEIKAELELELKKSQEKLAKMEKGEKWNA